ncbi:uncharacterized protein LOC129002963 [Macrosteles quadrilineatus]|uniref:uncharacterized protein LOC129002963 n=1 Tax=Macrosteles quadrilineatus TaxID=74068 RepID=UPI0023E0CAE2|nr:uncharacterized protein LOC129002963 [Macrosteles quadrilineatus]
MMRSRTKWRGGKDRLKEASRKLKVILKNSKKLSISPEDLGRLKGASRLQEVCDEGKTSENWLFYGTLGSGFLVVLLLIFIISGALQDSMCAPKNTTKDIQIQTIRIERLPLDGPLEAEDSTLFNDSEDGDEGHLRASPHLRLRRGR